MLRVDLHAATTGALETNAEVPADDPGFSDLEVVPIAPVRVSGRLMPSGPGSYYWAGRVETGVQVTCRRCLAPLTITLNEAVRLLFTEDQDNEDPSTVIIPPRAASLDLGDAIREALILAVPEYPLCREDCRGLCPRCGADLNDGPCGCRSATDPRWAALEALRRAGHDDETR
jgi:uncharacterized protein